MTPIHALALLVPLFHGAHGSHGAHGPRDGAAATSDAAAQEPGGGAGGAGREGIAPTAGEGVPAGVLRFRIEDGEGEAIPGRLLFLGPQGPGAKLFPNAKAKPEDLAVRDDVVYTLSGEGAITVPPGRYTVFATRGMEWGVDRIELELVEGEEREWTATLRREVDTTGWIGGDFHLHTLTYSGHGDADLPERVISLIGEGVEFAVATDHDHHTDYRPTIDALGAKSHVTAVTGNEVSTPIGHLNAFPLDPGGSAPDSKVREAGALFRLIRSLPNAFGVQPVIQLNHPRWRDIDYFGKTGLDPITGRSDSPAYSGEFDTIEVFNENEGWGYYDADVADLPVGSGVHSVLQDWFHLLNRGHRYAAVGNSDSHTVRASFAGWPRNFVASRTDDPASIDPAEVARALREGRTFASFGPIVGFSVDGEPMGGEVTAQDGAVELAIEVQAASWIDCDRVKVVVDGDVAQVIDVPDTRERVRLREKVSLPISRDSWIALLVEGDDPLAPVMPDAQRPMRPLAVANPVWVDGDGDGAWTSPWDQARTELEYAESSEQLVASLAELPPQRRAILALAAAEEKSEHAAALAEAVLADPQRLVVLAGARAAQKLGLSSLAPALDRAWEGPHTDTWARIVFARALEACGDRTVAHRVLAMVEERGSGAVRYGRELVELLPGRFVTDWLVVGYFESPGEGAAIEQSFLPERSPEPSRQYRGPLPGILLAWQPLTTAPDGYLDLNAIDAPEGHSHNAVAFAQTWIYTPGRRSVAFTLGSDDGCRVYLNRKVIYEDPSRHAAHPLQVIGRMQLTHGWNQILIKVENGRGDFGLYLRILDDTVTIAPRPG